MELTQIRYFLDVAQTQHVSKSAQRLHIAQPSLTKAIHKFEKELGVPLFMHKGRNIVLTQYGEYLKGRLEPIVNSLSSVSLELAQMTGAEAHTIRLSVLAASMIVTQAIIEYKKLCPQINFHVLQNPDNELFDIEVTTNLFYNRKAEQEEDCFLCTERIYLAVPNIEKYQGVSSINLTEVKDEGFISLFGSRQLRNICDKFCHHAGFEPNIIFESDSPQAVKNMIGANLGIGFWPEFTWGRMAGENVKLLEIENPICHRDILISYKSIKTDDTHSKAFYQFLTSYFKEAQHN